MRYLLFFALAAGLLAACSTSSSPEKPAANSAVAVSNSASSANVSSGLKTGDAALNAEANAAPAGNVIGPADRRKIVDVPGTSRAVLQYEPAADDSQIASSMN